MDARLKELLKQIKSSKQSMDLFNKKDIDHLIDLMDRAHELEELIKQEPNNSENITKLRRILRHTTKDLTSTLERIGGIDVVTQYNNLIKTFDQQKNALSDYLDTLNNSSKYKTNCSKAKSFDDLIGIINDLASKQNSTKPKRRRRISKFKKYLGPIVFTAVMGTIFYAGYKGGYAYSTNKYNPSQIESTKDIDGNSESISLTDSSKDLADSEDSSKDTAHSEDSSKDTAHSKDSSKDTAHSEDSSKDSALSEDSSKDTAHSEDSSKDLAHSEDSSKDSTHSEDSSKDSALSEDSSKDAEPYEGYSNDMKIIEDNYKKYSNKSDLEGLSQTQINKAVKMWKCTDDMIYVYIKNKDNPDHPAYKYSDPLSYIEARIYHYEHLSPDATNTQEKIDKNLETLQLAHQGLSAIRALNKETKDNSESSEVPEVSEAPEAPEVSEVPEVSEAPEVSEVSEVPESNNDGENIEELDNSDTIETDNNTSISSEIDNQDIQPQISTDTILTLPTGFEHFEDSEGHDYGTVKNETQAQIYRFCALYENGNYIPTSLSMSLQDITINFPNSKIMVLFGEPGGDKNNRSNYKYWAPFETVEKLFNEQYLTDDLTKEETAEANPTSEISNESYEGYLDDLELVNKKLEEYENMSPSESISNQQIDDNIDMWDMTKSFITYYNINKNNSKSSAHSFSTPTEWAKNRLDYFSRFKNPTEDIKRRIFICEQVIKGLDELDTLKKQSVVSAKTENSHTDFVNNLRTDTQPIQPMYDIGSTFTLTKNLSNWQDSEQTKGESYVKKDTEAQICAFAAIDKNGNYIPETRHMTLAEIKSKYPNQKIMALMGKPGGNLEDNLEANLEDPESWLCWVPYDELIKPNRKNPTTEGKEP